MRPTSPALPVFVFALAVVAWFAAALGVSPPSPAVAAGPARAFQPDTAGSTDYDEAAFKIAQGGHTVGRETFIHFMRRDTVFSYSTVRLDGLSEDSPMPLERRTTFLQRRVGSYPMFFEAIAVGRDTSNNLSVACVFSDTTVVVYRERGERGVGEALALPPGRLYLFEPGVYHPVQLLLADFIDGTQKTRKQIVFVPDSQVFIDLTLTRGAVAPLRWGGKDVKTTKVGLTDGTNEFIGWIDGQRKMLRLEAVGQGLVVERIAPAPKTSATKKGAAPKRSTPKKG